MWKEIAIKLAENLGDFIKGQLDKSIGRDVASSSTGESNVYNIDLLAEEFIRDFMSKNAIPATVISEDSEVYSPTKEPKAVMIIDPLDGSSNAVRHIPVYTTSIAVGTLELKSQFSFEFVNVGIVYYPETKHLYVAEKGKGAKLNGETLSSKTTKSLKEWYVGSIFKIPSAHDLTILSHFKSFRCFGCATEHLCAISRGDYQGYFAFDNKLRTVDIAAAGLIVKESGGALTSLDGRELLTPSRDSINFVASTSAESQNAILQLLGKV